MTSLPSLLGAVMATLQAHSLFTQVSDVETKTFSREQFLFKIRAELAGQINFQVRIYYNHGHVDYAYQVFTDVPILRWDNKEEFEHLDSYPHHFHDEHGNVKGSPLKGDPIYDIGFVLEEITKYFSRDRRCTV